VPVAPWPSRPPGTVSATVTVGHGMAESCACVYPVRPEQKD
jgi:hypothetical protein